MSALCCLGTTTDLTPGFWSAVATGSWLELDELLDELPPHAASPTIAAAAVTDATTCLALQLTPLMIPPGSSTWALGHFACASCGARRLLLREANTQPQARLTETIPATPRSP